MSPVKDRLSELQKKVEQQEKDNTIRMPNKQKNQEMLTIFDQAGDIRDMINTISENTKTMKQLLKENPFQSSKAMQTEMEIRMNQTNNLAYKITQNLRQFDSSIKKTVGKTELRMKKLQMSTITKQFQEVFEENRELIESYHEQRKNILKKQFKMTNQNLNDEEMEKLLEEKETPQVFIQNHLINEKEARRQLQEIEERHDELIKIEGCLREVKELFEKMAILIEQQKESINRVEYHAATATDYVEEGAIDLGQARKKKRKYNKRCFYLVTALLVITILVLLMLLL